jgi:hypothetical protein
MIYLHGTATPVIQRIAGFVAPYIVQRQFSPKVSEVELRGLMDLILDELEAGNLDRETYKQLRNDTVEILKHILATPVHQLAVTNFDREIFTDSQRLVPVKVEPPQPPTTLPETLSAIRPPTISTPPVRQADTEQLMPTDIMPTSLKPDDSRSMPVVKSADNSSFSISNTLSSLRRDKANGKKPLPPVPPLRQEDKKE